MRVLKLGQDSSLSLGPTRGISEQNRQKTYLPIQGYHRGFRRWLSYLSSLVRDQYRAAIICEELLFPLTSQENLLIRYTAYLHHHCKLLHFIFSREKWETDAKLSHDAAEAPHIYWRCIRDAKDDFRGSVKARLDVCVDPFILETRTSKINDLYAWFSWVLEQNVLRFEVTMYHLMLFKVFQSI